MMCKLRKYWFQILLILSLIIVSFGCSASKTKTRKKIDTTTIRDINEKETIKSTRKGDTLSYTVLNPILKDTVIYIRDTRKLNSNTLRITYDNNGRQTIDCISNEINELKETIRNISENESRKEKTQLKEKESLLNGSFIFYIFIGLSGLILVNKIGNKFI